MSFASSLSKNKMNELLNLIKPSTLKYKDTQVCYANKGKSGKDVGGNLGWLI